MKKVSSVKAISRNKLDDENEEFGSQVKHLINSYLAFGEEQRLQRKRQKDQKKQETEERDENARSNMLNKTEELEVKSVTMLS